MRRNQIFLLLIFCAVTSCAQQEKSSSTDDPEYFELINKEITGEVAYQTTAYVEKYWRVVGNAGFDSSIYEVASKLDEMGFVLENEVSENNRLTYRLEKRALDKPTWEPVNASLKIVGQDESLLEFSTNRNMIAVNSYSADLTAEVVYIEDVKTISQADIEGKIVFAEEHPYYVYKSAIDGGAVGIITYNNPDYLQPEKNTTSIQFRSIPLDEVAQSWCVALSYEARQQLKRKLEEGQVKLAVDIKTKIYKSEELTVVANIKGDEQPNERLVFSAHVQEPGANDNASGVGVALEMAGATAKLVANGSFSPKRTLTFLWGDEIVSTRRYVNEDEDRAKDIKWGISLDMVGQNTDITGGSFLIEKMPDPSAIWTRGKDEHTEWGATEMTLDDMQPHYLNDFVTNRFLEQGERANWKVKTNPFEGGSDHVPFLKANIPGVLFWHFTDQFYHTDNDRLDKVSKSTLKNVATAALVSAYTLVNADVQTAKQVIDEVKMAGLQRMSDELEESKKAIEGGATVDSQVEIIEPWNDWYLKALNTTTDMVEDPASIADDIKNAQSAINETAEEVVKALVED